MGKFRWAKLSRYSHYINFPDNTFNVQVQGAYMLYLEAKDLWEKLSCSSKNRESLAQLKLSLFTVLKYSV